MKYQRNPSLAPRIGILALGAPFLFSLSPASLTGLGANPATVSPSSDAAIRIEGLDSDDLDCCDEMTSIEAMDPPALLDGTVIQSTGAIEADLEAFRALLGNPINGTLPGHQNTGHREINWDAVPAAVTDVTNFPPAFFNTNSTRGLVYTPESQGLEVSDRSFSDINPTYAAEFHPFSGTKMFSPIGDSRSDVRFFVAGTGTEAAVKGFGAVFLDVDQEGVSGLMVFGEDGQPLARLRGRRSRVPGSGDRTRPHHLGERQARAGQERHQPGRPSRPRGPRRLPVRGTDSDG